MGHLLYSINNFIKEQGGKKENTSAIEEDISETLLKKLMVDSYPFILLVINTLAMMRSSNCRMESERRSSHRCGHH